MPEADTVRAETVKYEMKSIIKHTGSYAVKVFTCLPADRLLIAGHVTANVKKFVFRYKHVLFFVFLVQIIKIWGKRHHFVF